jgi:alpha-galactosidase
MPDVRFEDTDRGPALVGGRLRLDVHLNKGTFSLSDTNTGKTLLSDAAAGVSILDGPTFATRGAGLLSEGPIPVNDDHGQGTALVLRRDRDDNEPDLVLVAALYDDHPFVILRCELENVLRSPLRVASFQVVEGGRLNMAASPDRWRFYKHGWQSWSPTLVLDCSGEDLPIAPPVIGPDDTTGAGEVGRFVSEMLTAIVDRETRQGIVAGFTTSADQLSRIWLERDGAALTAVSCTDGVSVEPRAKLLSERLLLLPTESPLDGLMQYGDALAREMKAVPHGKIVSGWCSWYQYFGGVTEEQVLANLEFLTAHRKELPVDCVQVDDGYQAGIGDWLMSNEKFPRGMKWLAEQIHRHGFKAGLWLAPFLVGERSQLYREHPDWVVEYKPGKPYIAQIGWGQKCFALDLTRPQVIDWLHELFRTVCEDWGYDYVKIDFVYAGAVGGIHHDPNVTRAQAYRRGIETIWQAVGDSFVLGCGNPQGPSIGLVDGARVGPDVAPYWLPQDDPRDPDRTRLSAPSTLNSLRNTIARYWMHGRLWMNDPDCLLVRDFDTALSGDEVRALATVIAMSGGMVLDSDDLTRLSPERRRIISMLLPVYGKAALPLDLFESDLPRILELDCDTHRLRAALNWNDGPEEAPVALPEGEWHVYDVWRESYLGLASKQVTLEIPGRGCRLLGLRRPLGRPQVVGSTLHLLQGAVEIDDEVWSRNTLSVAIAPVPVGEGRLLVHVPDGYSLVEATGVEGTEALGDGIISLAVCVHQRADVRLRFAVPG